MATYEWRPSSQQPYKWNSEVANDDGDSDADIASSQTWVDVVRAYAIIKSDTFNWKQLDGEPFTNLSIDTLNNIRDDLHRNKFYQVTARPVADPCDVHKNGEHDMCTVVWDEVNNLYEMSREHDSKLHVSNFHRVVRLSLRSPVQVLLTFLSYFLRLLPFCAANFDVFILDVLKSCGNLLVISSDDSAVVCSLAYHLINALDGWIFVHPADHHWDNISEKGYLVSKLLRLVVPGLLQHWGTNGDSDAQIDDLLMKQLVPKLIDNVDLCDQSERWCTSERICNYPQLHITIFLVNYILDHQKGMRRASFHQLPPSYSATISRVFGLLFRRLNYNDRLLSNFLAPSTPNIPHSDKVDWSLTGHDEHTNMTFPATFDQMLTNTDEYTGNLNELCERLPLGALKSVLMAHTTSLSWYIQLQLYPHLTSTVVDSANNHPVNLQLREIIADLVSQSNSHPTNNMAIQQLYEQLIVLCAVSPYFPSPEYICSTLIPTKTDIKDVCAHQGILVQAMHRQMVHLTDREMSVLMNGRLNNILVSLLGLDREGTMITAQKLAFTVELCFYSLDHVFRSEVIPPFYKKSFAHRVCRAMLSMVDTNPFSHSPSTTSTTHKVEFIRVLLRYITGHYTNHWEHCAYPEVESYVYIAKTSVLEFVQKVTRDTAQQQTLTDVKSLISDLLSGNEGNCNYQICFAALQILDANVSFGRVPGLKENV